MGFFKKVLGGIGKPFRKVLSKSWKHIKSGFKKVMGFIGKLGIVGQIGLSLLLPGLGELVGGWAAAMMQSGSALVQGAGQVLNAAVNIGTKISGVVKSVTSGITKVVGQTVGTILNKIPGADEFVLDFTKKLGINAGNGIDISGMTDFSQIGTTFSQELGKISTATSDLFSKGTFTDLNSYAKATLMRDDAIQKTLETAQVNIDTTLQESNLNTFEAIQEKNMSLLEDPNFTSSPVTDVSQKFEITETNLNDGFTSAAETAQQTADRIANATKAREAVSGKAMNLYDNTPRTDTSSLLSEKSLGTRAGAAVRKVIGGDLNKANLLNALDKSGMEDVYAGGYGGGTTFDVPDMGPMTAGGMTAQEINFFNLVPQLQIQGLSLSANYQPQSTYARAMAGIS